MKHSPHKDFFKCSTSNVPLYPFKITFCIVKPEVWTKYHAGNDGYTAMHFESSNLFIYFESKKPGLDVVGHEVFHAVEFIMDRIGQKLSDCPNETWAYLMGWIMGEYEEFMR